MIPSILITFFFLLIAAHLTTTSAHSTEATAFEKRDEVLAVAVQLFGNPNCDGVPSDEILANSTVACGSANGGDTTSSMYITSLSCKLDLFNRGDVPEVCLDSDPSEYMGTYDPGEGVPGTCVQIPNFTPQNALAWSSVQAYAVACA